MPLLKHMLIQRQNHQKQSHLQEMVGFPVVYLYTDTPGVLWYTLLQAVVHRLVYIVAMGTFTSDILEIHQEPLAPMALMLYALMVESYTRTYRIGITNSGYYGNGVQRGVKRVPPRRGSTPAPRTSPK